MAKGKASPVTVYIRCRFCTQLFSCPITKVSAHGTEEMEIRVNLNALNTHMLRKHEGKLTSLAKERENEQRPEQAEEEPAQLDADAGRERPEGMREAGLLSEMGSQQVPAAFRVPGA